jgi:hypothetical protein
MATGLAATATASRPELAVPRRNWDRPAPKVPSKLMAAGPHRGHNRRDRSGQPRSPPAHHLPISADILPHPPQLAATRLNSLTGKRSGSDREGHMQTCRPAAGPQPNGNARAAMDNSGKRTPARQLRPSGCRMSGDRPESSLKAPVRVSSPGGVPPNIPAHTAFSVVILVQARA